MATPSLAMIPSAYADSKVYSVLPNNGDGDFTFDRASTATRIGQNGLIETVLTDIPRLNYDINANGQVQSCPSLLLEPASTNLIPYSEDFSQSTWAKQNAGIASAPIVTSNYAISPDGTLNADRVIFNINGGTTSVDFSQISDGVISSIGDVTNSIWIKSNTASNYNMSFVDPNANYTSIVVTNEWKRFDVTSTTVSTSTALRLRLRGSESTSDTADVSLYGAQLEEQSYATSIIPTNGASQTRAAETCNDAGTAATFNSTEGVLYAEIAGENDATFNYISLSDGGTTNYAGILYTDTNNEITYRYYIGGSGVQIIISGINVTNFNKIAVKWKVNDFAIWINGVEVGSASSGAVHSSGVFDNLSFARGGSNNTPFYGNCKDIRVFNEALTDAQLQTLTTL